MAARWASDIGEACPMPWCQSVWRPWLLPSEGATASLALRLVVEHTKALVASVVVLRSPLTHSCLTMFIGLSERVILVQLLCEVASSGTRCSCCKPMVLVTLRGCHILDDLVTCDSVEAHEKIVWCSEGEFARGYGAYPMGIMKSNSSRARCGGQQVV